MKTKPWLAAWVVGSAVAVAGGAAFAADKDAKPAKDKPAAEKPAAEAKMAGAKPAEPKSDAGPKAEAKSAAADDEAGAAFAGRLTKPWSDITSLTDEQKTKLAATHKKALAEINAIEKKELEDSMALLTDAQRAEMKDAADKKRRDAAAKRAAEKKAEAK